MGVSVQWGVCLGVVYPMGVSAWRRGVTAQGEGYTPPPPVDRQTPVKHYLSAATVADGDEKMLQNMKFYKDFWLQFIG